MKMKIYPIRFRPKWGLAKAIAGAYYVRRQKCLTFFLFKVLNNLRMLNGAETISKMKIVGLARSVFGGFALATS
jgi:hypothetical protein